MTFFEEAVAAAMPLWRAAADEDFLTGMGEGTLDRQAFLDYIVQDSLYLRDYLKAYAMALFKSQTLRQMQVFYSVLGYVNDGENATRLRYLSEAGLTDDDVDTMEKKPACAAYTDFLLRVAREEDVPEIVMAVMPCMVGSRFVFEELLRRCGPMLRYIIAPILSDPREREECLSDVVLLAWEKIESYDPKKGGFSAWLSALARNIARSAGKRETVMRTLVCLEVFDERGLIQLEHTTDHLHIALCQVEGKVDLEASWILRRLREMGGLSR